MSHAETVKDYCNQLYIIPARASGDISISIRAGDVHKELKFTNRFPLVCSAIGATVFEETYRLKRVNIDGPLNGANTIFTFLLI